MNITIPNWVTVLIAAGATALPTFISSLPLEYAAVASAVIAALASIYHLYQPVPGTEAGAAQGKK
jgi:hypothetical protein